MTATEVLQYFDLRLRSGSGKRLVEQKYGSKLN